MESPRLLGVRASSSTDFDLTCQFKVVLDVVAKIIWINEVLPGVVRRIDVNQLDLARITLS